MAPGNETRQQLISAALHLFGRDGYAATTTRAVAARAGANIGLIAYHFGGKPQLRRACAEAVVQRLGAVTGAVAAKRIDTPEQALAVMDVVIGAVTRFLVADPAGEDVAAFILREMAEDGEVVDLFYAGLFEGRHREFCRLWGLITGQDPESETVRLAVFAMIGQVVYFRIGRPVVRRRMGWSEMGEAEAARIARILTDNLHAVIERSRQS